jgi:hypothetical protein
MFQRFDRLATRNRCLRQRRTTSRLVCDALESRQLMSGFSASSPPSSPALMYIAAQAPTQTHLPQPCVAASEAAHFPPVPV